MRNRTALMLLELVIMLLVFLLAAALCLRAFAWADSRSLEGSLQDQALLQAQNAAETLKAAEGDFSAAAALFGGQWDGDCWQVRFNEAWEPVPDGGSFALLGIPEDCEMDYLGAAQLRILDDTGRCLAQLRLCWQEAEP